jgi:hypothetical protein
VTLPVRFPGGVKSSATIDRDLGEPIAGFANRQRNGAFPQDPLDKDRSGHAAADSGLVRLLWSRRRPYG